MLADSTKSILFPLILNPDIKNETLVFESIIHLDFEGLFAEAQRSILSKSQLIKYKQELEFT